jgi:hypothetical protein
MRCCMNRAMYKRRYRVCCRHCSALLTVQYIKLSHCGGTQWRSWLRHCAASWNVWGCSIPDGVTGFVFFDTMLPAALWPGVDSACNRSEYQEYFLRGEGGRCVRLTTLPPSCSNCLEIWEPQPGTLRACPGLYRDCNTLTFWWRCVGRPNGSCGSTFTAVLFSDW